jgi:tetratricopeptide (TPR) repeat protein
MHQTNKIVVFISLLAALCQPAFASAFYDGTAAYRAHNYQLAMMDFQKAIQEESGPKLAASYYRLGASYEKLKDYPNAVECFKSAQSIDGSLAFTSNHQKFLDRMDRDATIAAQSSSSSSNASFFSLEKTLLSSDVYIDPALTTLVSKENLAAAVSKTREAPVKIAVLDRLPGWYYHFAREHRYTGASSLGHYAKGVHTKLHMQKSGLVLICLHGMGAGICMVSDAMTASESKDIASRYAASIETGNYDRIGSMAADFSDAIAQKDHTKTLYISIAALVLIFAILGAMALLSRKRRSEIVQAREAIQGLKENIQSNIDYIDGYIPVLASGDPNKEKAIKFRQDAAALYEEAVRSIDNPKSVADLDQAHGLLVKAKKDVQIARDFLDKALGGSKNIPGARSA